LKIIKKAIMYYEVLTTIYDKQHTVFDLLFANSKDVNFSVLRRSKKLHMKFAK